MCQISSRKHHTIIFGGDSLLIYHCYKLKILTEPVKMIGTGFFLFVTCKCNLDEPGMERFKSIIAKNTIVVKDYRA